MSKKAAKGLFIFIFISLAIFGILIGIYLNRANYYGTHFYKGTTMSGIDVSGLTVDEATEKVTTYVSDYLISVFTRDGEKNNILGPNIGYTYVPNGEIEAALLRQNKYKWLSEKENGEILTIELNTTYDKIRLRDVISSFDFTKKENMTSPTDAYICWDDFSCNYTIIPETEGSEIKFDKVCDYIEEAVDNGLTSITITDDFYCKPLVTKDDEELNTTLSALQAYFGFSITYTFGDEEPFVVDPTTIASWLSVDDRLNISVDEDKVERFVQSLASKYNTYGDKRKFNATNGDIITIGGGDYGWVIDKKKEKEQLLLDLETNGDVVREPIYSQTAKGYGKNEIGDTYVEVDYTNQHIYYYVEGELVMDSDVVTGNVNKGNGSPDGIFKIVYKEKDATLVGEGYSSAVSYFMPFAYNVGFHDASWRSKFGGEIYLTNGSHGCVNCPASVAEALYGMIEVGTPVVAYYRQPVELTAENARISNAYSYVEIKEEETEETEITE